MYQSKTLSYSNEIAQLTQEKTVLDKELKQLKNEDQYKRNKELQKEIKAIEDTYTQAVTLYEQILDLRVQKKILPILKRNWQLSSTISLNATTPQSAQHSKNLTVQLPR